VRAIANISLKRKDKNLDDAIREEAHSALCKKFLSERGLRVHLSGFSALAVACLGLNKKQEAKNLIGNIEKIYPTYENLYLDELSCAYSSSNGLLALAYLLDNQPKKADTLIEGIEKKLGFREFYKGWLAQDNYGRHKSDNYFASGSASVAIMRMVEEYYKKNEN